MGNREKEEKVIAVDSKLLLPAGRSTDQAGNHAPQAGRIWQTDSCHSVATIELNKRMNATLERMAQALFKSWFVHFDPVIDNALAAGNPIPEELTERRNSSKSSNRWYHSLAVAQADGRAFSA